MKPVVGGISPQKVLHPSQVGEGVRQTWGSKIIPSLRHLRSCSVPDAGDRAERTVDPRPYPKEFPSLNREFVNHHNDSKGSFREPGSMEQKPWVWSWGLGRTSTKEGGAGLKDFPIYPRGRTGFATHSDQGWCGCCPGVR